MHETQTKQDLLQVFIRKGPDKKSFVRKIVDRQEFAFFKKLTFFLLQVSPLPGSPFKTDNRLKS
jgi:hypothetical protein